MFGQIVLVGIGGCLGSVFRYLLSGVVQRSFPMSEFPFGTLVVNVVGCLLIGMLHGLAETKQIIGPELRLFLMIGLLGGFTTFSTFGYETMALIRDAEVFRAMGNVVLQVLVGLTAVWLGDMLGRVG
ncbi:MAG: fluoride efflux transporter CrcB [Nitrospirota bacterium]|nr:fluoride efflux transporter CrcB [Nitrospirota bacterium]